MSAPAIYEHAIDTVKGVGARLPIDTPIDVISVVEWPDGLADRAAEGFAVGLDTVKDTVAPAAVAAAGAGAVAADSTTRWVRRHPTATAAGLAAVIAAVVWFLRRRRADESGAEVADSASLAA